MIEVQQITKRFGPTVAVKDVSFQVSKGEVVGFLGPNGAGKSTTMRILTCYLPADEGTATIAGHDIFQDSLEVRKVVGYLPENAPLYGDMEVISFLRYISDLRDIPDSLVAARIDKMVDICGLEQVLNRPIGHLSKGFRQRVGLAQCLIHDPEILILDEPTSGLDPNQIVEIRQLIKEIGKEKTVILSTHILPEVTATCNRVIIIHQGRVVADGTPEQLADRSQSGEVMEVVLRGAVSGIKEFFSTLAGMKFYKLRESPGADVHSFELRVTGGPEIEEAIFRFAADNGYALRAMHRKQANLEDVFKSLTTEEVKS
ncbi:ATP-binding cassette domain-containing protein [bacterium]|nr:ATP-binding cassette domain-containing protein [candidate division CSSED10-310 bacterium]